MGRPRSLSFPLGAWPRDKNCVGSRAHSPVGLGKGCPPTQGMRDWVWLLPGTTLPRPFRMRCSLIQPQSLAHTTRREEEEEVTAWVPGDRSYW